METPTVCRSNGDCRANELCVEQRCRAVCNRSNDCAPGQGCYDGVCLSRRDAGLLDAGTADRSTPDTAASDIRAGDTSLRDLLLSDTARLDHLPVDIPRGDSRLPDAQQSDARRPDTWQSDSRLPDARQPDAWLPDTRLPDAWLPDAWLPDAWQPDTAVPNCGTCNEGETCTSDGCLCPALGAACNDGEVCLSSGCCATGCADGDSCCGPGTRCCPSGHCDDDCDSDGRVASQIGGDDCDDDCDTCFYGSTHGTRTPDGLDQDCDGTADNTSVNWICDPATGSFYLVDNPACDDACAAIACEAFCQQHYGVSGSEIDFSGSGSLACWTSSYIACGGAYWCTEICIRGSGPVNCTSSDPNVDVCSCETAGYMFF